MIPDDANSEINALLEDTIDGPDGDEYGALAMNDTKCKTCFVAGDARVNEFPGIFSFFLLFHGIVQNLIHFGEKLKC